MSAEMERHFFIDHLRVASIIMVMISHTVYSLESGGVSGGILYYLHTTIGQYGVSIFIIISGFLAANALSKFSTSQFYINRITGLLPPIWVAFVFSGCIALVFKHIFGLTTYSNFFKLITDEPINFGHLLATIVGFDGYLWVSKLEMRGYLTVGEWFTGFIIIFLAIAPLCSATIKKFGLVAVIGGLCLSFISYHSDQINGIFSWISPSTNKAMNPATRIFEFMFGIYLYNGYSTERFRRYIVLTSCIYVATLIVFYIINGLNVMTLGFTAYLFAAATVVIYYEISRIWHSETINKAISRLAPFSFVAILIHRRFMDTAVGTMPIKEFNEIGYFALFVVVIFSSFKSAQWVVPISRFISSLLKSTIHKSFCFEQNSDVKRVQTVT
ncbi:acyltransferase family protein [Ochrobactrum sp. BTU1]|uniref:acyltransferase family protein n=1 Tax=Ochrobactrum sp. BTU1 TaxID=2840456 RepID=UPI001C03B4B8|nr:acyltransferase family protein [Ochrobactrum sp. BTU1]